MNASPIKLKSGKWGVRVKGSASVGDSVHVVAKSGKSWDAEIERVVWSGDGVSICSCASSGSRSSRPERSSGDGRCRDCGGAVVNAPHHRAMGGLCGACAFDEYDC